MLSASISHRIAYDLIFRALLSWVLVMSLPLRCVCCGFFVRVTATSVFFLSVAFRQRSLTYLRFLFAFILRSCGMVFGCLVSMSRNFSRYWCYYNKRLNIYHRNVCRYDSWISVCDLIAWLELESAYWVLCYMRTFNDPKALLTVTGVKSVRKDFNTNGKGADNFRRT